MAYHLPYLVGSPKDLILRHINVSQRFGTKKDPWKDKKDPIKGQQKDPYKIINIYSMHALVSLYLSPFTIILYVCHAWKPLNK